MLSPTRSGFNREERSIFPSGLKSLLQKTAIPCRSGFNREERSPFPSGLKSLLQKTAIPRRSEKMLIHYCAIEGFNSLHYSL
ncbi:MAG: hypothetical protein ACI934_001735 [Pseudohongiellaceae bacterium]|jgi:hypothetical protein